MNTSAHLIERHTGVVDLRVRNRPGIASYVFGAAASLDTAFAGTTTMFTVLTGRSFRSRTLRMNNINRVEESSRGLTKVTYNPNDYASATIPGDANISFVRVAEEDLGGVNLGEGPILVVPPPGFFRTGRSNLALNGTAPNVAGLANNMPPPDAMIIDFPRFTDEITIVNTDAVSLFVSTQVGTQEFEIPTAGSVTFTQTGTSELYLRGETATATFKMFAVIVNGIQG